MNRRSDTGGGGAGIRNASGMAERPSASTQLEHLELLSSLDGGLITTARLRESGLGSGHVLERMLSSGVLVRIRHGAYALGSVWQPMRPEQRYRLFVMASARVARHELTVSHLSAAAMHGLPLVGAWPRTVHVLEPLASGGGSAPLLTRHRGVPQAETVMVDGVRVTALARTLADVAVCEPLARSVPALDAALRQARRAAEAQAVRHGSAWGSTRVREAGRMGEEPARSALRTELEQLAPRRWRARAERALAFANGAADSVGESLSRVRFLELGFEIPELQVRFDGADGHDAFADCYWRGVRKIGEFDGEHKYLRGAILKPGQDPGEIVFREKRREDALRRQVDSVSRWTWDIVLPPLRFNRFLTEHEVPRASARP